MTKKRKLLACAASLATWLLTTSATWACPSCPVGRTARQQVLDQEFGTNIVVALAPFLLVGLVARWAEKRIDARAGDEEGTES